MVTARALEPPTTRAGEAYARDVRETPARAGGDAGDVAEAVAVACDALIRRYTVAGVNAATRKRLASCVKDVVLLTDDVGAKTMPGRDDEFVRTLLEGMRAQNIRLKVGVLNETELARTHLGVGARVARGDERRDAFAALRDACEFLALDDGENESAVTGASDLLLDLQRKRVRPTAGFRGALSFGFNARVNVSLYKLNAEAAPAKLNKYSEELAHRPEESHKTMIDVAFRNVNDLDGELVPVERHVKAYRYGKQHVPVDAETENRLSARFEKGMKVIGSIRASEAPAWLVTGEPSLCVPQQSSKTTGLSKERAEADARAESARARARRRRSRVVSARRLDGIDVDDSHRRAHAADFRRRGLSLVHASAVQGGLQRVRPPAGASGRSDRGERSASGFGARFRTRERARGRRDDALGEFESNVTRPASTVRGESARRARDGDRTDRFRVCGRRGAVGRVRETIQLGRGTGTGTERASEDAARTRG